MSRRDSLEERVLVFAPTGRDAPITASVLSDAGIGSLLCGDAHSVVDELARGGAGAVLVAQEALTEGALEILLRAVAAQPAWSDIPVVLIASEDASVRSHRRTLDVVDLLGHVTLLDRPVRLISLLSAVRVAIRARRRQYEARDLLVRLQEGVEQRDRFLAMLGHELRNPLTAISYAAAMLPADASSRQRDVIQRQSRHLARIVDELLDVARVTSNKVTLHRTVVNLRALVESCVEAAALGDPGSVVTAATGDAEVPVDIDTVRMEQVVTNLLVNAIKYTPRGGNIRVSVRRDETGALLSVEDDGVGVSAEMLPRIFDPFTQIDSSLDRARGGLGLGLTVVRGLVELHGGSVCALSEGLGRGTRFEIRLPLAAPVDEATPLGAAPVEEAAPGPGAPPLHPRHLLIVEDDADIRDTLQETLEHEGHLVRTAPDGAAAIAQARVVRPEVALVDIGLPGMTGYDLARTLRAEFGATIYLAAMTGYGLPVDRQRAHEAGFDVHLTKPVDIERLRQLVRQVPERPRVERALEAHAGRV